jgi:hypothetical protein
MTEVVMEDMAIGNPASFLAQFRALEPLFLKLHITHTPPQVIGIWPESTAAAQNRRATCVTVYPVPDNYYCLPEQLLTGYA